MLNEVGSGVEFSDNLSQLCTLKEYKNIFIFVVSRAVSLSICVMLSLSSFIHDLAT